MPTPIPTLLDACLQPSRPGALTLVTSVLDATSNWLLLRFLYAAIHSGKRTTTRYDGSGVESTAGHDDVSYNVVFISFMRDIEFWQGEGKRLTLDLASLTAQKRLLFIDGLSRLFRPSSPPTMMRAQAAQPSALNFTAIGELQQSITSQIAAFAKSQPDDNQAKETILFIDAPDLPLAATPGPRASSPAEPSDLNASSMINFCMSLRSLPSIRGMVASVSADGPLVHHSPNPTSLQVEHKTFLVTMAHQAEAVLQLRPLDTGRAKDVSGVIRVSRGGAWEEQEQEKPGLNKQDSLNMKPGSHVQEGEWLYYVSGNGEAKVWGRGEAGLT